MKLIHIYCGNGKGKTTAALGLALRAAGAGMRVHIFQFMKGNPTSEIESLKFIPNIAVSRLSKNFGFISLMTNDDKKKITMCHNNLLKTAHSQINGQQFDMIIIDEFFAAYNYGLVDRELAEHLVLNKEKNCELILTGRDPSEKFITAADYVSEINAVKHPYKNGISARKGIEY